jgi:hypothetical protein
MEYISPTPLLLSVFMEDNVTTPDTILKAYAKALEPKQLQLLPGGHWHAYDSPVFGTNAATQLEFVKKWLL